MAPKRTFSKVLQVTEAAIASFVLGLLPFFVCQYGFGLSGYLLIGLLGFLTQNTTQWFDIGYRWGLQLGGFVGVVTGAFVAFYAFKTLVVAASTWRHLATITIVLPIGLFWISIIAPFMLNTAIKERDMTQVHLLVMLGGNADASAARNNLETAARRGNKEIVSLLIARGTKVHQEALSQAISSKNTDVIEILIDKGANVNHVDQSGWTPLIRAIHADSGAIVKLLLAKGANANINNPLNVAIIQKRINIASQLLSNGANVNVGTHSSDIPLHIAARTGQVDFIRLLIQYGADVNFKSTLPDSKGITEGVGLTALEVAVQANQIDAARALLGAAPTQYTQ